MIRRYQEKDLAQLLDAWYSASLIAHPFLDEAFLAQERQDIPQVYLPRSETWVFEREGTVVGFVSLLGNEVGAIFVDARYHGQGIGFALMSHARRQRPMLELDVFAENAIGRRFYDRFGFTQVGQYVHEETGHLMLKLQFNSEPGQSGTG